MYLSNYKCIKFKLVSKGRTASFYCHLYIIKHTNLYFLSKLIFKITPTQNDEKLYKKLIM